jgi:hypothetical protein
VDEALTRDLAATMAPYKIFKVGGKFVVKNNAGDVKSTFTDRDKAVQYLRALYVNVKGAPKAAARKKFTGTQKRATNEKADVAHGAFKDAQDAMKHKHKYRPMKGHVHVDFIYGGAGSINNGGVYGGSPCAECGQSPGNGGHTEPDADDTPTGSSGAPATASLLEGAGGYPCPCGRDFASATSFAAHLAAWADLEDRDGTLEQALAYEEARTFTAGQRKKAASSGAALPDGSFPIQNGGDLRNAIQAIGRASNPAAAKAHIKKRAKALGMTNLLPQDWSHDLDELACLPCERRFATENALVTHLKSVHR